MSASEAGSEKSLDLLLKGGHVIDPANGIDGKMDVGIKDRKIARVAPSIPEVESVRAIYVSDYYVTPGIIDIHTHVYTFQSSDGYVMSMTADAHLPASGVTTTVDAGTAGWKNFTEFKERCIDRSKTRILAFLNIASGGMAFSGT